MKKQRRRGKRKVLHEGRYLRFIKEGGWEYVQRSNCTAIVIIVSKTDDGKVVFVEQYRPPVRKKVIEFPAGLVSDERRFRGEALEKAALRELREETGYQAKHVKKLLIGPVSAGSTSDLVTMVRAYGLKKVDKGGGDGTENITVHEVPLAKARVWLKRKEKQGYLLEPKIFSGLYFLNNEL
jgi:ADP-ribose pyrophosphatase